LQQSAVKNLIEQKSRELYAKVYVNQDQDPDTPRMGNRKEEISLPSFPSAPSIEGRSCSRSLTISSLGLDDHDVEDCRILSSVAKNAKSTVLVNSSAEGMVRRKTKEILQELYAGERKSATGASIHE